MCFEEAEEMESKWPFGFDKTGDLEGPASVICVHWLNT
jgi:hypothetical protein